MVFNSFTRTWIQFFSGNISEADISSEDSQFVFSCTRKHLFPDSATIAALGNTFPVEVTWADNSQSVHNCSRVPVTLVSSAVRLRFGLFLVAIGQADRQGRVTFREDTPEESARFHDACIAEYRERWGDVSSPGETVASRG